MPSTPPNLFRFVPRTATSVALTLALGWLLLVAIAPRAIAQEQERKLMDRIMEPDMTLDFTVNRSEFFKEGSTNHKAYYNPRSAATKEFHFIKDFNAKSFSTRDYYDNKGYARSDATFKTDAANLSQTESLRRAIRDYQTKDVTVKTAHDAHKTNAVKEYATTETRFRGRAQDQIDREGVAAQSKVGYHGNLHELKTIDDIRELLNKNE
ncbi:MAG TPA: hypothetical protein VNQ90_17150 [Chthoniobacteraceae bacterium]|nr:hypothetical protein [Chthoniobacteraceae bacterium]